MTRPIVIGGASGFWGEAAHATRQLLGHDRLDFLVYDYLAEITMSIMARARAKDSQAGYATDFVTAALAPNLKEIAARKIRVISNAGGVNPKACADAVRELAAGQGLDLRIAVVTGDDLTSRAVEFAEAGVTEMFSGAPFPDPQTVASINAYLGAFPIAKALDEGADIVITGRCVDSAVTLGACIHAFGWGRKEFDLLAAGSLAGHLLECGPQATGGNFTDWREAGDIAEIGYPLAEMLADGAFTITKPAGTTGIVSPLSVGEQMLYEIGDPRAYLLPDVTCDFSEVTLDQEGENRVRVAGAKGRAPSGDYKVSATHADGFRAGQLVSFNGFEARDKARAFADAAFARARKVLRGMNAPDYDETGVEISGGSAGDLPDYEEVTLKIAARHRDARAIGLFLKELVGLALATPAGMSMFVGGGRPKPSPVVRLFSFLAPKAGVPVAIDLGSGEVPFTVPELNFDAGGPGKATVPEMPDSGGAELVTVPLIELAVARSGDKGDKANIGVIARRADLMPWIWAALSEDKVAERFSGLLKGGVERHYLPGSHAMNIVLHDVLGGGGVASLRADAQGKGYGQMLLAMPVAVPKSQLGNRRAA